MDVVISEEKNVKVFIFKASFSTWVSMICALCTGVGVRLLCGKPKNGNPAEYNVTCLMVPELRMPGKED